MKDFLRWKCQECGRFLMNVDLAAIKREKNSRVLNTHCSNCSSDNTLNVLSKGNCIRFDVEDNLVRK